MLASIPDTEGPIVQKRLQMPGESTDARGMSDGEGSQHLTQNLRVDSFSSDQFQKFRAKYLHSRVIQFVGD